MNYCELHAHSYYSFLDGVSSPSKLVEQASRFGMPVLALTDHNGVYGAVPFIEAAYAAGIQPVLGAELTLEDGSHLTLLVESEAGWGNLCYLITVAHINAPKGQAALPEHELEMHTQGLIALSGYRKGKITQAVQGKRYADARNTAVRYRNWFGQENFFVELQNHELPTDKVINARLIELADTLNLSYVATNNVHYSLRDEHPLQDIVSCIRTHTTLETSRHIRRPNSEYVLKSHQEMQRLFARYPLAIEQSYRIANRCTYLPRFGVQDLPEHRTPNGQTTIAYLRERCESALPDRFTSTEARIQAQNLLNHEIEVIARAGLDNYFLVVADIMDFSRSQGIRAQGRGSAANSITAYLLGISPVDPITHHLVFERFLSEERVSVPDIDIDFAAGDGREKVIQYVFDTYGRTHAAMACTFVCYRRRSSVQEVGKALGLAPYLIEEAMLAIELDKPLPLSSSYARQLAHLSNALRGNPRHVGLHNGGMVLMRSPLSSRLPTEPATMPGRSVVQWDKAALETAQIAKVDILGLRMLSTISETVHYIEAERGQTFDLDTIPPNDPAIYSMLRKADTIGIFQVESRAQAQTLPRLKPASFNDIILSISIIRPGPVQGNMVHPFLNRRQGREPVSYLHFRLEAALEETLGVILFQEQVLKVARDLAGFTPGQGELLRRALGAKEATEAIERFREEFVAGAIKSDVLEEVAEAVFDKLTAFGGYSFPKSHAAAFAHLVYQSAYLKKYHPTAFITALLNNQPMGFWTPAVLVNDARRHGIDVKGIDINRSQTRCTIEDGAIRLGFSYIQGFGENWGKRVEEARGSTPFYNLNDMISRTDLPLRLLERLILVGACDEWDANRRRVLATAQPLRHANPLGLQFSDKAAAVKPLTPLEQFSLEVMFVGIATGKHITSFYRKWMKSHGILGYRQLSRVRSGSHVEIAGETVIHQSPPTAKGFHFLTLEDEDGMMNVIVRPKVYQRYKQVLRQSPVLWISGMVEKEEGVTNILCERVSAVPPIA